MTASEQARIDAAVAGWITNSDTTAAEREALRASNRAHVARALPWVLWGNPNKPAGGER